MADIAKLDAALAYIEEHPEEWDQFSWGRRTPRNACGTAGCIAFHVGRIDGAEMTWWGSSLELIGGASPSRYARESLDLRIDQSTALFMGNNSLDDLKAMRDALAKNPDATDRELMLVRRDF